MERKNLSNNLQSVTNDADITQVIENESFLKRIRAAPINHSATEIHPATGFQDISESQTRLEAEITPLKKRLLNKFSGVHVEDYNQEQEAIDEELTTSHVFDKNRTLFTKKTALITIGILLVLLSIGGGLLGIQSFNMLKFQAAHNALYQEKLRNSSSLNKENSFIEDSQKSQKGAVSNLENDNKEDDHNSFLQIDEAVSHNQSKDHATHGSSSPKKNTFQALPRGGNVKGEQIEKNSVSSNRVNINTATVQELENVKGIGPITAQKIVRYRTKYGKFKSINDLKKVSGIGDVKFQKLAHLITI